MSINKLIKKILLIKQNIFVFIDDPSGNRELSSGLRLAKGTLFSTTKCCASGTC